MVSPKRDGTRYGKVTLSPIKKRNKKKSSTVVNLPFVQSQRKELQAHLERLRRQHDTNDGGEQSTTVATNSVCGADGGIDATDQSQDNNERSFANMEISGDILEGQMCGLDEEIIPKKLKANAHAARMALHRRWQELLPTLHQSLLEFTSRTTGHVILPIAESDLMTTCLQPGSCAIKEVPVLCLFLDRTSGHIYCIY